MPVLWQERRNRINELLWDGVAERISDEDVDNADDHKDCYVDQDLRQFQTVVDSIGKVDGVGDQAQHAYQLGDLRTVGRAERFGLALELHHAGWSRLVRGTALCVRGRVVHIGRVLFRHFIDGGELF